MNRKSPGIQSNLRSGVARKAVFVVAPALAAIVALAGVTTPRAYSISQERIALELADARLERCRGETELAQKYRALRVAERCRKGIEFARAGIPPEVDGVVAQGTLRLAAEQAGLKVLALAQGAEIVPELASNADRIVAQGYELTVSGPLAALARLETRLRALGSPCCITAIHAELPSTPEAEPTARVMVGLLHFAPLPVEESAPSTEEDWNQP